MPDSKEPQLDAIDRQLIVATQSGLARVTRPYDLVAEKLGITVDEVIDRMQRMLANGVIRRIGAVPNHYAIGYTANGMSVWDVDDSRIDELGSVVGALDFVTHCYRRPRRLPHWPYNLFAMVHGHNRAEVEAKVVQIEMLLGEQCHAHEILYSTQILKKTGLRITA